MPKTNHPKGISLLNRRDNEDFRGSLRKGQECINWDGTQFQWMIRLCALGIVKPAKLKLSKTKALPHAAALQKQDLRREG